MKPSGALLILDEVLNDTDIEHVPANSEVGEVLGTEGIEGVRVNGEVIACTGLFPFVGLQPTSSFLPVGIELDGRGAILTSADRETTLAGVFAAGAVRAGCGGSLEDAVADGEAAASAVATRLLAGRRD